MKTIVVSCMERHALWYYADPMEIMVVSPIVCSKLAPLRARIDVWLADNPGNNAVIEHDNETLPLMNDSDWAIALLRFGP